MITLCIDSAHKYLTIALYDDEHLLASVSKEAWKQQSELIFPELMKLMEQTHLESENIDQVVITDGPGSYTGVRIAMTIAKVFCTRMHKPLYKLSSLLLYANDLTNAFVMMDARSNRAYTGTIINGDITEEILTIDEMKEKITQKDYTLYGDTFLINKESKSSDFVANFMKLKSKWELVDNVHTLVPRYLKDQDAYKV